MKLPHRFAPILFGLLVSGLMSFVVSGVATLKAIGPVAHFLSTWLSAWALAWSIAFPLILLVAPLARRLVARLTLPPPGPSA